MTAGGRRRREEQADTEPDSAERTHDSLGTLARMQLFNMSELQGSTGLSAVSLQRLEYRPLKSRHSSENMMIDRDKRIAGTLNSVYVGSLHVA